MPTTTIKAQGWAPKRGDAASPEVFTAIGKPFSIGDVGESRSLRDITGLADTRRQYRSNIPDGAEVELVFYYDDSDTQQSGLKTDMENETRRNFQLVSNESPADTLAFTAIVIDWTIQGIAVDGDVMLRARLKIVSAITIS